jgi:phenol/toluene 2-monooxygenase (NADH) P1/A1
VQYELRTLVIEPKRKTFTNLAERYGDRPATRYEEGSVEIQAAENFHYRPLWNPEHELFDPAWSALKLTDPDSFTDPRQYYYAPYVTARAHLHEAFAASLDYLDKRDLLTRLPGPWAAVLGGLVIPLRHYESGAQMISTYGCRFAYGSTVEQCCSYAAFDRVGNAQLLSRVGLALGGGTDTLLGEAKAAWTQGPALQPLRRLTEELLVEEDWAVAMCGLDLTDQLLYALVYRHLDETALLGGAGGYSLVAQHLAGWFADQRRWVDALLAAWAADPRHGAANAAVLAATAQDVLPRAEAAVGALAVAADELVAADCGKAVAAAADFARARMASLTGSQLAPAAPKEA